MATLSKLAKMHAKRQMISLVLLLEILRIAIVCIMMTRYQQGLTIVGSMLGDIMEMDP